MSKEKRESVFSQQGGQARGSAPEGALSRAPTLSRAKSLGRTLGRAEGDVGSARAGPRGGPRASRGSSQHSWRDVLSNEAPLSTVPGTVGQLALDYAIDYLVIPETFSVARPAGAEDGGAAEAPAAVEAPAAAVEAETGGRPARDAPAPAPAAAPAAPPAPAGELAPEVLTKPSPVRPPAGLSPQALEVLEACRVAVVVYKSPLAAERRRAGQPLAAWRPPAAAIASLRTLPDEASFPAPPRDPSRGRPADPGHWGAGTTLRGSSRGGINGVGPGSLHSTRRSAAAGRGSLTLSPVPSCV